MLGIGNHWRLVVRRLVVRIAPRARIWRGVQSQLSESPTGHRHGPDMLLAGGLQQMHHPRAVACLRPYAHAGASDQQLRHASLGIGAYPLHIVLRDHATSRDRLTDELQAMPARHLRLRMRFAPALLLL